METKPKETIEEIAEQLLIWKVKGEGDISHIIDKAEVLDAGIQNLVEKGYLVNKGGKSKPDYHVTLEGFEYVFIGEEELAKL